MKTTVPFEEPGLINTSYVVLFHLLILVLAPFLVAAFPTELRSDALLVAIVFPILLFWFSFLIKQFIDAAVIFKVILGATFVVAILTFINAVNGPLSAGSVPLIYTEVPFFATLLTGLSGQPGFIYAGTILAYGAYTYLSGVALASLLERLYERYASSMLPRMWRQQLKTVDAKIDTTAVKASDQAFVFKQTWGIGLCLALLAAYAALYLWLLIVI